MTVIAAGAHPRLMTDTTDTKPEFTPTHEMVAPNGKHTIKLRAAEVTDTFVDEKGRRYTRVALENMGSLRRVLPTG